MTDTNSQHLYAALDLGSNSFHMVIARENQGQVQLMDRLREINYDGVVSLHSEYKGGSSFRQLDTRELLEQSGRDLGYLKSLAG